MERTRGHFEWGASLLKDIYALSTCSHNQKDDGNSREGEALSESSRNQEDDGSSCEGKALGKT